MPEPKTKQQVVKYRTWERLRRFLAAQVAEGGNPESQVSFVSRAIERELDRRKAPRIDQEAA